MTLMGAFDGQNILSRISHAGIAGMGSAARHLYFPAACFIALLSISQSLIWRTILASVHLPQFQFGSSCVSAPSKVIPRHSDDTRIAWQQHHS